MATPTALTRARQWERTLWHTMNQMQEAHPESVSETDLETLTRLAWKEAHREVKRLETADAA